LRLLTHLFSEVEPREVEVLKQPRVLFYLLLVFLLLVVTPFFLSEKLVPPSALKRLVSVGLFFVLFLAFGWSRRLLTPWQSTGGLLAVFGFAATAGLAVAFYERVTSVHSLFLILTLSLGFYSVLRLCTSGAAVSYATLLLFLLGASASAVATVFDAIAHPGEAGSFPFSNPNYAGSVYAAASAAAIALVLAQPRLGVTARYSTPKLLPLLIILMACILGLVATRSRGSFLALAVSLPFLLAVRFPKRSSFLLSLVLVPIFCVLFWALVAPHSFWDSSAGLRLMLWRDSLKVGLAHIPQGCSFSRFFAVFPQFASADTLSHPLLGGVTLFAHSFYIDVFTTCGLLVVPLLLCIVLLLVRLYREARSGDEESVNAVYASLYFPTLFVFFLHGLLDSALSSFEVASIAVVLLGAACSIRVQKRVAIRAVSTGRKVVGLLLFLVAAYFLGVLFYKVGLDDLRRAELLYRLEREAATDKMSGVGALADRITSSGVKDYRSAVALHRAARVAHKRGFAGNAFFYFERLLYVAPDFGTVRYELFRLYREKGREEEAMKQLRRYLKTAVIPPAKWKFLANLGEFLLSEGELELAAEVKERARLLHKKNQKSHNR